MTHIGFAIVNKHGRVVESWLDGVEPTYIAAQWDTYLETKRHAPHRVIKVYADAADKVKLWTPTVGKKP